MIIICLITDGHSCSARLVDGNATDNSGIIALLRRNVKNIIAGYANSLSIRKNEFVSVEIDLLALFGLVHESYEADIVSRESFKATHHVFPVEKWDELQAGLISSSNAGKGASYLLRTPVLPNPLIALKGGYEVNILFVLIDQCDNWRNSLDESMKKGVSKDGKLDTAELFADMLGDVVELDGFPFIPISSLNF